MDPTQPEGQTAAAQMSPVRRSARQLAASSVDPTTQASGSTAETAERIFPARAMAIKSPAGADKVDNPFNRLYGLRSHESAKGSNDSGPTARTRRSMEVGPGSTASPGLTSRRSSIHPPPLNEAKEDAAPEPDENGELLKSTYTQEDLVENGTAVKTFEDPDSTKPHESIEERTFRTTRFEHRTADDGTHHVFTGLKGAGVQACEDEPIHTPGAIQSFGVLMTLLEVQPKVFQVQHVSEV